MGNGKIYNIVQNRITKKYYICENERPINCDRISFEKLKKENIKFKENNDFANLFCKNYSTIFREIYQLKYM